MSGGVDGAMHERTLGLERQLERRLERRGQLARQPEQLERWQRVRFPLPISFLRSIFFFERSFCKDALAPTSGHTPDLFDARSQLAKLFLSNQFRFPSDLNEKTQRVCLADCHR